MDILQASYWSKPAFVMDTAAIEVEIKQILETARRVNPQNRVTGALVFTRNSFVQILEGPEQNVVKILDAISADPRHNDVQILSCRIRSKRDFADWAMAFAPETPTNHAIVSDYCRSDVFDPRKLSPERLIDMVRTLIRNNKSASVLPDYAA